MKTISGAESSRVKAPKYPTKRTVNLAQRESHSRSTLTLSLGLLIILLLSFCVANFGVLRQLDRQRAAEQAYSTDGAGGLRPGGAAIPYLVARLDAR